MKKPDCQRGLVLATVRANKTVAGVLFCLHFSRNSFPQNVFVLSGNISSLTSRGELLVSNFAELSFTGPGGLRYGSGKPLARLAGEFCLVQVCVCRGDEYSLEHLFV